MPKTGPKSVETRLRDLEERARITRMVFLKHFFFEMNELHQEFEALRRRVSSLDGGKGQHAIDKFERALAMMKLIMGDEKVGGQSPVELFEICRYGPKDEPEEHAVLKALGKIQNFSKG